DYAGKIKVGKVDVDAEPELAGAFGVSSIPTLLLLKDGEIVERAVGARPKAQLAQALRLDEHVTAAAEVRSLRIGEGGSPRTGVRPRARAPIMHPTWADDQPPVSARASPTV